MGTQGLCNVPAKSLDQQKNTGHFQTAAGTAGTGSQKHQENQKRFRKRWPKVKVGSGISRCGHDGAYLERCMANGFAQGIVQGADVKGDQSRRNKDHSPIQPKFFVEEGRCVFLDQDEEIHREVDTEQSHEDGGHPLNVR